MPTYKNPGRIEFDAPIKTNDEGGVCVDFPYDVQELFGTRARHIAQAIDRNSA